MSFSMLVRCSKHLSVKWVSAKLSTLSPNCFHIAKSSVREFFNRPEKWNPLVKCLRLSGISISCTAVPILRSIECKKLSKRIDHLREESSHTRDASLGWNDLWSLISPHSIWLFAAVVAAFLTALLNVQLPLYLGDLIDAMADIIKEQSQVGTASLSPLAPIAGKLILSYLAQAGLTFLYISFLSILGERMAADLRNKLFHKLLLLDMSFYDEQKTGELSSRLNVDVQEFKSCFKMTIAQGLRTVAQVVGCMWSLCRISSRMTLLTMLILPVAISAGAVCGLVLRSLSRQAQAQSAIAAAVSDEAFNNIRTIRAFAMEDQEMSLYSREVNKATALHESLGIGIGLFQGGTNLLLNGVVLAVLYGGSGLIANGELSPGDLMSFLVTAQTIQRSLAQLSIVFGSALKGYTAGGRVMQFANLPTSRAFMCGGVCIPYHSLMGEIVFDGVSFSYPSRPDHQVLNDLHLRIPAGQVVALCGPSGEGKSTIVSILERFYEPCNGQVTLDGKNINTLNVEWLRGQAIGLISQEPVLFATSICENIRYGRPGATDAEVEEAARLSNAHSFVTSFPQGYNTVVGERGVQLRLDLSGGQRQRIAIARALLKNPPILILDEATSALDTESEKSVHDALESAMKGRTVLIIAHRLSTLRNAHKIVVIKGGRVVEEGTHNELVARGNVYANLVTADMHE